MPRVELVGELGTTADGLDCLGKAIAVLVQSVRPRRATERLGGHFPLALVEFLVAVGIHDYRKGDYWSSVIRRTGVPQQVYPGQWGELFERTIDQYGLERFNAFREERATRFVSKILAHGGIPTYCLADFFAHLLVPVVTAGDLRDRSAAEVIQAWQVSPSAFIGVDQPVRRFLIHGGAVAQDFLGRCFDMAEIGVRGELLPDAADLGLPGRIVEQFAAWLAEPRHRVRTAEPGVITRYVKPNLSYDPWASDALNIFLPAQPAGGLDQTVSWRLTAGTWARHVDVSPVRRGAGAMSRPAELRVPEPFSSIDVALAVDEIDRRSWRYLGLNKDRPILAFRPTDGQLIEWSDELPASELWLIAPATATLRAVRTDISDDLPVVEELPFLAGAWAPFRARTVDLRGYQRLELTLDGQTRSFPLIEPAADGSRPWLVAGNPLPEIAPDDRRLVYTGPPPELRLPLPIRAGARLSPDRWRIRIHSLPGSSPVIDRAFHGDELPTASTDLGNAFAVDLAAPALLGSAPFGQFEVTARGPLGRDARFDLIVIPPLVVSGTKHLLIPDTQGPPPVRLTIRTPVDLEPVPDAPVNIRLLGVGEYRVDVPGHLDRAPLVLRGDGSGPDAPRLTMSLPLRRVHWAVTGLSDRAYLLGSEILRISRDEIDQAEAPTLIVDVPGADPTTEIGLDVEDQAGRYIHRFALRSATKSRRFSLREMMDSVRDRPDARLLCVVTIRSPDAPPAGYCFTAAVLTRDLQISDLMASDELAGAVRHVCLTWREAHPVTNRVVRLWPLWRLWEDTPPHYSIDDNERGQCVITTPRALLAAGDYRAELAFLDPWLQAHVARMPDLGAGNCADIALGTPEERAEYLVELPNSPLGTLEYFLATHDHRVLDRLIDTLPDDDVPATVRAALALIEVDEADALADESDLSLAMATIRLALMDRSATLAALADLSRFDGEPTDRLCRLVVEMGLLRLPASELADDGLSAPQKQALWRLWPPLFLAFEVDSLLQVDPVAIDAAVGLFGPDLPAWLPCLAKLAGAEADIGAGQTPIPFQGVELSWNLAQLRALRNALRIMPTSSIDPDAWILANFDWLIRLKDDARAERRAVAWLSACLHAAQSDLDRLQRLGLSEPVAHVERRWPTADHGPLRMLPFVVGTTALVERAVARGILETSTLLQETGRGIHSPREAFVAAAELYTRDLCVMDLLVVRWLNKRGAYDH